MTFWPAGNFLLMKLILFVVWTRLLTPVARHPSSLLTAVHNLAPLFLLVSYPIFSSISACCRCGKHLEWQTYIGKQGIFQPMYNTARGVTGLAIGEVC